MAHPRGPASKARVTPVPLSGLAPLHFVLGSSVLSPDPKVSPFGGFCPGNSLHPTFPCRGVLEMVGLGGAHAPQTAGHTASPVVCGGPRWSPPQTWPSPLLPAPSLIGDRPGLSTSTGDRPLKQVTVPHSGLGRGGPAAQRGQASAEQAWGQPGRLQRSPGPGSVCLSRAHVCNELPRSAWVCSLAQQLRTRSCLSMFFAHVCMYL